MSENLCLQWNDFKENVNSAFVKLRDDRELTDVTLACEDGQHLEAHKAILAASSPFFGEILFRSKHPHPLIYLRGFKSQDLVAILDFLYCGKASVLQQDLDSFLAIADELKLKGLAIQSSSDFLKGEETPSNSKPFNNSLQQEPFNSIQQEPAKLPQQEPFNNSIQQGLKLKGLSIQTFVKMEEASSNPKPSPNNPNELFMKSTPNCVSNDLEQDVDGVEKESTAASDIPDKFDLQVLDKKVKSMMEKSQNKIQSGKQASGAPMQKKTSICKVCGKEGMTTTIRNHIEANHLQGISIPCDRCDKDFTSRVGLTMHKGRYHR